MSEKSFFEKTGPYKLKILSDHINGKLSSLENSDVLIDDISSLKNAKDSEITFFSNLAYKKDLKEILKNEEISNENNSNLDLVSENHNDNNDENDNHENEGNTVDENNLNSENRTEDTN